MLALIMVLSLAACSSNDNGAADDGEKILHVAESFAYPSLDAHKEYYGWYTSIYGITEALFKMGDDSSVQPCLADLIRAISTSVFRSALENVSDMY